MLKSLVFLALVASLVTLSTQEEACEGSTRVEVIENLLTSWGYDDTYVDTIDRLANEYSRWLMSRAHQQSLFNPGENQVTTMTGILTLFFMVLIGDATMQEEILSIYNLTSVEQVEEAYPIVQKLLNTGDDSIGYTSVVNLKIWDSSSLAFSSDIITKAESYGIEMENIDYSDAATAASTVNTWASGTACAEGSDLYSSDEIPADSGVVVAAVSELTFTLNASVIIGDSTDVTFTSSSCSAGDATSTVSARNIIGYLKIAQIEDFGGATLVSIPLEGSCSINVVKSNNLADMAYYLEDPAVMNKVVSAATVEYAQVLIPMESEMYTVLNMRNWLQDYRRARSLLVRPDEYVCSGIYESSNFCGILSGFKHSVRATFSGLDQTTECSVDTSGMKTYTIDGPYIGMVMCPLQTPRIAWTYYGQSS